MAVSFKLSNALNETSFMHGREGIPKKNQPTNSSSSQFGKPARGRYLSGQAHWLVYVSRVRLFETGLYKTGCLYIQHRCFQIATIGVLSCVSAPAPLVKQEKGNLSSWAGFL